MKSSVYVGRVIHHRFSPVEHRFEYPVFTLAIFLDELREMSRELRLFSLEAFNLFSLSETDYIDHRETLRRYGISEEPSRELLVTTPRVLGYGFNPVSFYYAWDGDGRPIAAIAEVNNTFGETKPYVIGPDELMNGTRFRARRLKEFYISPFLPLDAELEIDMRIPGNSLAVAVTDRIDQETVLRAVITGTRTELSDRRLLSLAFAYPLLSLKVVAAIHFQALRLWLKRVPFFRKSDRPERQTGLVPHRPKPRSAAE